MKRITFCIAVCLLLLSISPAVAQLPFSKWAAGIETGDLGFGVNAATPLAPHFVARTGLSFASSSYKDGLDFTINTAYMPTDPLKNPIRKDATISSLKASSALFKILVDFYPSSDGIFSITGGFYLGSFGISADGLTKDYHGEWVDVEEGVTLKPTTDGRFSGKIKIGNAFKPYLGVGLGRSIGTYSRLGFRFDLGLMYQGKMRFESKNLYETGSNSTTRHPVSDNFVKDYAFDDYQFLATAIQFYPVIQFSLSYRFFGENAEKK